MLNLQSCTLFGHVNSYCEIAKPIYFSKLDKVTRQTDEAVIAHNQTWAKLCK